MGGTLRDTWQAPSCSSALQLRCLVATLRTALATFQTLLASLELHPSLAGGSDRRGSASAPAIARWELPAGWVRGCGGSSLGSGLEWRPLPSCEGLCWESWGLACGCARLKVAVLQPGLAWLHRSLCSAIPQLCSWSYSGWAISLGLSPSQPCSRLPQALL